MSARAGRGEHGAAGASGRPLTNLAATFATRVIGVKVRRSAVSDEWQ